MRTSKFLGSVAAVVGGHHVDVGVAQQLVDHLAVGNGNDDGSGNVDGNGNGNGNGNGDKESLNKEVYPKLSDECNAYNGDAM